MKAIVYVSHTLVPFEPDALEELAQSAALRNEGLGVTGYLYFEKRRFIQYIEGEETALTNLFDRIHEDPRHEVLASTHQDHLGGRRFPAWHMHWLRPDVLVGITLERVLSDYLLFSRVGAATIASWQTRVWPMVDRLSELRVRLFPGASPAVHTERSGERGN